MVTGSMYIKKMAVIRGNITANIKENQSVESLVWHHTVKSVYMAQIPIKFPLFNLNLS